MRARFPCLLLTAAVVASPAQAGLLGHQVTVNYHYAALPVFSDPVTVSAGIEMTCPGVFNLCGALSAPTQTVDFGDTSITYTYVSTNGQSAGFDNVTPNGFSFTDLDVAGQVLSVALTTNIAGLNLTRVSFTSSSVTVDMHGLGVGFGAGYALALTIPEPASALLLGLGSLLALGARRRG